MAWFRNVFFVCVLARTENGLRSLLLFCPFHPFIYLEFPKTQWASWFFFESADLL